MLILLDLDHDQREIIRQRLIVWLAEHRLGYGDFAAMVGVSLSSIKQVAAGNSASDDMIRRILRAAPGLGDGLEGVLIIHGPPRD